MTREIDNRPIGVGHVDAASLAHQPDLGHAFAFQALGRRPCRIDVHETDIPGPAENEIDNRGVVHNRVRIGLDNDRGDTARGGGHGRRLKGFFGLGARFAGFDAKIDQAGAQHRAFSINRKCAIRSRDRLIAFADLGDPPVEREKEPSPS